MSWMYVLQNPYTKRYYIGSTVDLERRLRQHKSGNTRTTRVFGTTELVYCEKFMDIEDARERERQIKSYKSKKYIENLISGA